MVFIKDARDTGDLDLVTFLYDSDIRYRMSSRIWNGAIISFGNRLPKNVMENVAKIAGKFNDQCS